MSTDPLSQELRRVSQATEESESPRSNQIDRGKEQSFGLPDCEEEDSFVPVVDSIAADQEPSNSEEESNAPAVEQVVAEPRTLKSPNGIRTVALRGRSPIEQ